MSELSSALHTWKVACRFCMCCQCLCRTLPRDLKRKMPALVAALKAFLNPPLIKQSHLRYVICSHSCGLDVRRRREACGHLFVPRNAARILSAVIVRVRRAVGRTILGCFSRNKWGIIRGQSAACRVCVSLQGWVSICWFHCPIF